MAAARAKQLFLLNRDFKAEAAELCQYMEEADCCAEVLQVFDAGGGVERDVQLLDGAMDRLVGVAQADNGCVTSHLISASQQEELRGALSTVGKVIDGSCLDRQQIQSLLIKRVAQLPLVALWMLHQERTLRLDHLFTSSASNCLPHLADILIMSVGVEQSERPKGVVQGVVRELVQLGYDSGRDQDKSKVVRELLLEVVPRSFAERCWERGEENSSDESAGQSGQLERFSLLDAIGSGDGAEVFVEDLLGAVFQQNSARLEEVVSAQCTCTHSTLPRGRRVMLSQAALILPHDRSIELIWTRLKHKQPPWRGVLDYLSCLLHTAHGTGQQIAALLRSHADTALQSCDSHMLRCVLIVARQSSLEGAHIFQSYHQWFQGTFGNSPKTLISTKRQLTCLLQTLKDLVPHEPVSFLKAHLRSPPRGLAKCHEAVHSYLSSVRARLRELNEPLDSTEPQSTSAAARGQQAAQGDVLTALVQYRDTKRVPQSVMQASLFKKPYYIGRFLPALLMGGAGVGPDLQSTLHQLISELRRAGKIPPRLLAEYDKQTSSSAADTDMDHSSSGADQLMRDVHTALRQISAAVTEQGEHRRVSAALSKLSSVLCTSTHQLGPCLPRINLADPGLQPVQLQVVDAFLTSVCETVAMCAVNKEAHTGAGGGVSSWLGQVVKVFVSVSHLIAPLVVRLWDLLSNKLDKLSDGHLYGLAMLCVHLSYVNSGAELIVDQRGRGPWWVDQTHPFGSSEVVLKSGEECAVFLLKRLSTRTWEESVRSLHFLYVFLHYSLSTDSLSSDSLATPPFTAALQWFTCLKRRLAQVEGNTATHCSAGGPTRKKHLSEATQLLRDCDGLEAKELFCTALQTSSLVPLSAWLASELAFTLAEQHSTLLRSGHLLHTALESYLVSHSSAGGFEGDLQLLFCESFAVLSRLRVADQLGVEGYQCGLALLQSLIQAVVAGQPTDSTSTSPPSLVSAVRHTVIACVDEGETSGLDGAAVQSYKAVLLKSCLQVCSHLPSHLMVTDSGAAVGRTDLSVLAKVLLADHACLMYEHRLLPLQVVWLVIQGFIASLRLSRDKTSVASLFEQLVTRAPIFFGSLCFWRGSLPHDWSKDLSIVVEPVKDNMAAVLELVSGSINDTTKAPLSPSLSCNDDMLVAAVVCAFAKLTSTSSHGQVHGMLHRLLQQLAVDTSQHDKVCIMMLDLVLAHLDGEVLVEGVNNKPHPLLRVAATCLERCPSAAIAVYPLSAHIEGAQLLQCLKDFRQSYPIDSSTTFGRPLTFFWVVRNMTEQSLVQLCQHSCVATAVRRMYASCLALQADSSIDRLAKETDRQLLQPFSVEFLQHISSLVRRALPS